MSIYYQDESVTLYHGDCFDIFPSLADGSVDALITDPPYNIGKAGWDNIPDYEGWCGRWIAESSRVLDDPGAFWIFHSEPLVLAELTRMVESHRRKMVSWITLDKTSWGMAKRYKNAGSKSFPAAVEYATYSRREVYAEQIRAIREEAGLTRAQFDTVISPSRKPTGITYRWEHGECIPQPQEVAAIESTFGSTVTVPTFHNAPRHQAVWEFPKTSTRDHPTPKPLTVMERMVETTTNPGDLILEPFAGSGTTLLAASNLGRRVIAAELDEGYCEGIANRLSQGAFDLGGAA